MADQTATDSAVDFTATADETEEKMNSVTLEAKTARMCLLPARPQQESPDKKEQKKMRQKQVVNPIRTCTVMCMSFLFAYTANLAIQNLQSSLNQAAGLGITSLAVLYGSIIVFGTLSPAVIRILNAKRTLTVAWVCHALYTLSNFYPTFLTLLTSSLLLGVIAGPMWTAQGLYISASGMAYAQENKVDIHAALSKFNGIFFACYEATQITGNLISSLVLMKGTYNESYTHNPGRICGADVCPGQPSNATEIQQPDRYIVYMLLTIFLACNLSALILCVTAMPPLPTDEDSALRESLGQSLTSCLSMLLVPRMLLLLPFFMAQAMNSGILLAEYTQAFVSCSAGVQWVGYVMAAFGLLTAFQAVGLNFAAKCIGRRVLFPAAAFADMSVVLTMALWNPLGKSVGMLFILPTVAGFAEGIFQAQFNSLVAMVFPDRITGAFATYHTSKATAFTLTFVLARFVCLRERLYFALALSAVGLLGYVIVEISVHCGARTKIETEESEPCDQSSSMTEPDDSGPITSNSTDLPGDR